jgi:hypothetical protein
MDENLLSVTVLCEVVIEVQKNKSTVLGAFPERFRESGLENIFVRECVLLDITLRLAMIFTEENQGGRRKRTR